MKTIILRIIQIFIECVDLGIQSGQDPGVQLLIMTLNTFKFKLVDSKQAVNLFKSNFQNF